MNDGKNMTDRIWAELLEKQRREISGLVTSRYQLEINPYALYKLTDMTKFGGRDDCHYFDMNQHEAMIDWLHENGLGTLLIDRDEINTWYFAILVRRQSYEADELLFKLRWWDEGMDRSE